MSGTRYVYFAQRDPAGLIKIGISIKPKQRVAALWAPDASNRGCKLLAAIPVEPDPRFYTGYLEERRMHARFAASHVGHEWFNPTPDLLDFIDTLTTQKKVA